MTKLFKPAPDSPLNALPAPTRSRLQPLLLGLVALSLIPAGLLAAGRVRFENSEKTVTLMMDYPALSQQAKENGLSPAALLSKYQNLTDDQGGNQRAGINGVAVYEDTVGSLVQRGDAYFLSGNDLIARNPGVAGLNPEWSYMRSIRPGAVEKLLGRYGNPVTDAAGTPLLRGGQPLTQALPTKLVQIAGQQWVGWSVDPRYLPAGPNTAQIDSLKSKKLVVAYRPYGDYRVLNQGADWPDVPFISFNGAEVIGARNPALLSQIKAALGKRVPTIIENSVQKDLDTLIEGRTAARMFSLSPSWQNSLTPDEVASKFALAARERTQRVLYLRPFKTIGETQNFLKLLSHQLRRSNITVTQPVIRNYEPSSALRWLSMLGPLAALLLIGLSYPLPRLGLIVAGAALLGALGLNGGQPFPALALVAAISFPALGLTLRRTQVSDWFVATGFSILGVLFVSALGTDKGSMLGLDPFSGVGLTLIVPIGLVLLSFLPRRDIRQTVAELFAVRLKLGDVIMMGLALGAFSVAVLRRGNTSSVGVSGTEAKIRQDLQDAIIRPRFKEVFGHPLLLLGLSGTLPGYFTMLALLGGLEGQASILNTFSHFHTPLLISAQRAFYGLAFGLAIGLVAIWLVRLVIRVWNNYGGWNASARLQASAGSLRPVSDTTANANKVSSD